MKYLLLITLSFLIFSNVNAQYSREEAMDIVINEIVGVDTLPSIDLYSKYEKAYFQDTLWVGFFPGMEYYIFPYNEQWVFFIDDMPVANWSHDTRFVFFDSNSGEYIVEVNQWGPLSYHEDLLLFYEQWDWYFEQEYTREEAIDIIINEVVGADSLEIKELFSRKEKMTFGDSLWMFQHDYYYFCHFYEQWVFFINDAPPAYWAHPCRVIFFKVSSGVYTIHEDDWPPDPWLENFSLFLEEWDWITSVDISSSAEQAYEFNLFPNPSKDNISIQCTSNPEASISIYISDITGKAVYQMTNENQSEIIILNTSELKNGLYFMNVFENGVLIQQEKFVKLD